ncbi:MAG: serine--tRNA ligase [Acidobacteria bacterium]|nr:serine--tRNA ligase [Acidobacteriota bacterium]NIM61262.1 serine--tRNA ligase [Acidobacteriota bacterium]NIQ86665.1 serine--tRNA ligase [Acidobacteriota bacterium]NIT12022.1 serine--tRNA ligase [Acidobacteriota bacterium]
MLDLAFIRENADRVREALAKRKSDAPIDTILQLDADRRAALVEVEGLKKERNEKSKTIGQLIQSGGDVQARKDEVKRIGARISEIEEKLESIESKLQDAMFEVPNLSHESVPVGDTEEANVEIATWGDKPEFDFEPLAHWDLGTNLGILDFERAAKIAGARFALYFGDGARLERALIQFMLDLHTGEHGYTETLPPFLVNRDALIGTGQLPKFEEDLFKTDGHDLFLIPTAEVPVTNIHADEILDAEQLPLAYCAYTPCFRSEAGSYGKDVRGLIRQHQFNKVELVRFAHPDHSYDELETLTRHAETVLERLELPYRRVVLCTGDTSFTSAKTYDLEVWLPAQRLYREISSCSNFEAFQARRAKIRYREAKGEKPRPLHTLNGSGLAVGRTLVAILENYQQADGSVVIPEVLRHYMGGRERITAQST